MHQEFSVAASPEQGSRRIPMLRSALSRQGAAGFIVPQGNMFHMEQMAERDLRLAWLTGFTGSAGACAVTADRAAMFTDGRYRIQVRRQTDPALFEYPEREPDRIAEWLAEALPDGGTVGFDPWLHAESAIERLRSGLDGSGIALTGIPNPIDELWEDQPDYPRNPMQPHGLEFAGESADGKIARISEAVAKRGARAAIFTRPDSIAWLLNIRGSDIAHMPVKLAFAILIPNGGVRLFLHAPSSARLAEHAVSIHPMEDFEAAIGSLPGPVLVDPDCASHRVFQCLADAGAEIARGDDPCRACKTIKNATEIAGMIAAHERDGTAMIEFLAWLDRATASGTVTEIDAAIRLEEFRADSGHLRDISFDTISASGPNAAIIHYRVTEVSNRTLRPGELYLVDSGGQYPDGTTDVTRTVPIGEPDPRHRKAYTLVLKGLIALSEAHWPEGRMGRDLDPVARYHLWREGMDFGHGTGHGVGHYLSVHESPPSISPKSDSPIAPGQVLSIEPGYYVEDDFGIRLENLACVNAPAADDPERPMPMLSFATLTRVPFDGRLIAAELLTPPERLWLDRYHSGLLADLGPRCSESARAWLEAACLPIA